MFTKHIAEYVLGKLDPSSIPEVAVQALVEGYDSPSLRILAGESYSSMDPSEVIQLFHHTLIELGISMPSVESAARTLICFWTRSIVEGLISPGEGLSHIIFDVYHTALDLDKKIDRDTRDTLGVSELNDLEFELNYIDEVWYPPDMLAEKRITWDQDVIEESIKYLQNQCAQQSMYQTDRRG